MTMQSKAFRSLQESVYNVVAGIKEENTLAEDLFIEYLEGVFGADNLINESVDDEDIAGALLHVLELAEAIEYVIEKRDRSAAGLSQKLYRSEYDSDQGYGKEGKRAPKVADAAHKAAKKAHGKLAGDAMRARAKRQAYQDEYGSNSDKEGKKNNAKIAKLGRFIARRTGQNAGDGRGD